MKRLIFVILNIILACSSLLSSLLVVSAADSQGAFAVKFELSVDGESIVYAEPGEVITVGFTIRRTDAGEEYLTNGFQNYIHYDLSFFEFVEDSIVCYDTGTATAKKQSSITYGEIIQCQNMGKAYFAEFLFCTFQLKVLGETGFGMVYNDEVYSFDANYREVLVDTKDLQVIVTECSHGDKIKTEAQPPSCYEKGWSTYYRCADCGFYFDETGKKQIFEIPYLYSEHSFGETMMHDENGHWSECTICGDKAETAGHTGGVPTCSSQAACIVCGGKYGAKNPLNHTGERVVMNERKTQLFSSGYSGDVFCSDCGGLIESGRTTSASALFLLLIVIIFLIILLLLLVLRKKKGNSSDKGANRNE